MAEPLPQALAWIDAKKRQAMADVAQAMEAPETIGPNIWAAVKDLIKMAGGQEDTGDPVENSRNAMMGIGPGGGGAGGLIGAIRPKGNPALMFSHGLTSLEAPHGGTLKELMHPSLAITGPEKLNNPFGSGNYNSLLIPKVGAFDPAYSPSTLFNRDAYTARKSDYPGGSWPTPAERMISRELSPPRGSEGASWATWDVGYPRATSASSHDTAIQASPAFRSFAEFEKSKKGAGVLDNASYEDVMAWATPWTKNFQEWWGEKGQGRSLPMNWINRLRDAVNEGDQRALQLLRSAQHAPSEYAELKVSGPVPITGGSFAGAILSPSHAAHAENLMARGIPSVMKTPDLTPEQAFRIADAMQRMAGSVKERSLRVRAGWEPGQDVPPRPISIEARPE